MNRFDKFLYIGLIALVVSACKVTNKAVTGRIDYYVTAKGDTLRPADSLAVININRLIKDTVEIIGVGDIMMGTNFPEHKYLPADSGRTLLHGVRDILRDADVTFGNHEGVILDQGGMQKECDNPALCYLFRSPEFLVNNLVSAGFDVVSLANNHAGDFGDQGRANTMRVLDSAKIYNAGLEVRPYTTFMIHGMKYGFAAFAPNTGTMSINDLESARNIVSHLEAVSDIVIVSFHGGAEGSGHQRVPRKNEIYYGEDRGDVYAFAHAMVDAGADIIFGHGPHVTRAVEVYKDRFIAYSLGNFCTYARFNLKGHNGIAPIVKVYTSGEGKFYHAEIVPIVQTGLGIPRVDPHRRVIKRMQQLTREDFPEVNIAISDEGLIRHLGTETANKKMLGR